MSCETGKPECHTASSKIPTPSPIFRRSSSVRLRGEKATLSSSVPIPSTIQEDGDCGHIGWKANLINLNRNKHGESGTCYLDDDVDSICSIASNFSVSTTNSTCEHVNFAKNGTTYSGRSHKYIVHCSSGWNEQEEYLTPTQRANRSIKRLKTLLQLAKEKLREKEEEIFKLNKEVIELKTCRAELTKDNPKKSLSDDSPSEATEESVKECSPNEASQLTLKFSKETHSDLSPINHNFSAGSYNKMSSSPSQDGFGDRSRVTPDFIASSMADSGNFDDLPSSASIYSRDSLNFIMPADKKQECKSNDISTEDEDKLKIINMYEEKLGKKKLEYEMELNRVINDQEQQNIKIIREFEDKLKQEELKFETRWNELLKATEEEKMIIVNRFEEKLEEEKKKYRESLTHFKAQDGIVTDMVFEMTYNKNVEEEKTIYETSLLDIKQKFECEKLQIQKKFDNAMTTERNKFEDNVKNIKKMCESQVTELLEKVSHLETEYSELLPKYEEAMTKTEELEKENQSLREALNQQEENHRKMYLTIFNKGQEAAKLEYEDEETNSSSGTTKKVPISELFAKLKITEVELENLKDKEYRAAHNENQGLCLLSSKEAISLWLLAARKAMYKRLAEAQTKSVRKEKDGNDPEATLQFLKSAVYYFLTDRENHLGHLKAIESILAFSSTEKSNIEKLYLNKY